MRLLSHLAHARLHLAAPFFVYLRENVRDVDGCLSGRLRVAPLVGLIRSANYGWRLQRNGLLSCPSKPRQ